VLCYPTDCKVILWTEVVLKIVLSCRWSQLGVCPDCNCVLMTFCLQQQYLTTSVMCDRPPRDVTPNSQWGNPQRHQPCLDKVEGIMAGLEVDLPVFAMSRVI
jgi:hypothetical protein